MERRSFLKSLGSFLALAYVAPTALIPEVDAYVTVQEANTYYTVSCEAYSLGSFESEFIRPAAIKLANDIDNYVMDKILKGE